MFQSSFILVLKTGDLRSFVVQLFITSGNHTVRRRRIFFVFVTFVICTIQVYKYTVLDLMRHRHSGGHTNDSIIFI